MDSIVVCKESEDTTNKPLEHLAVTTNNDNPAVDVVPNLGKIKASDGMQSSTKCMILELSTEVLQMIARVCVNLDDYPDRPTLLTLRATCRDVELRIRSLWRKVYFSSRTLRLEIDKLQQLCELTSQSELANEVKYLDVRCVDMSRLDFHCEVPGPKTVHTTMLEHLLRRAFRELTNVMNITFIDMEEHVLESTDRWNGDNEPLIDFSTTFATILGAAEDCGLHLRVLGSEMTPSARPHYPIFGIVDCEILMRVPKCPSNITLLELSLHLESFYIPEPADIGRQLVAGLNHLKKLKIMRLSFPGRGNMSDILAEMGGGAVVLSQLESLRLTELRCDLAPLAAFLRPHAATLRVLDLKDALFLEGGAFQTQRFVEFLQELRDRFDLIALRITDLEMLDYSLSTQGSYGVFDMDEENEDGYIEIQTNPTMIILDGDDLKDDISNVLGCLRWIEIE